ncbi:hypothetical protein [Salinithrix halophila]|uniref:Uncharacterized protein n=1 Tax=Salinithrix halophila TaxID=1485204 RepID=A0ABV8J961_9BACL
MNTGTIKKHEILEIMLSEYVSNQINRIIESELKEHNPYFCDESVVFSFAQTVFTCLEDYSKRHQCPDTEKLITIIKEAHSGGNIPPLFIRNTPCDPVETLLPAENRKGFDYGESEHDRMKLYFYSEWVTWLFATLLNHDALVHPSEHGGKNRFHLISPVNNHENLRNVGASTGGGNFYQHNDATVHTEVKNQSDVEERLKAFKTDLNTTSRRLNKPVETIISEITCGKFTRVDALLLKGILNLQTETHIGTPRLLQKHLEENSFNKDDILSLSQMPIAHIAGMADGKISGYVGEINRIINLDKDGTIIATCLNGAENRLIYVGKSDRDQLVFERFLELLRTMPTYKVLLTSKDLLFIPNSSYGKQTNASHGRGRLTKDEYKIPIGKNKYSRRMICRQYVSSRMRDNKESRLGEMINGL